MVLTVRQLYRVAQNLLKDESVRKLNEQEPNGSLRQTGIYVLQSAGGDGDLFKECGLGDELHLTEKNGRIYCFVTNLWDMWQSDSQPVTDDILKSFELTEEGESFVYKFLWEREESKHIKAK